MNHSPPAALHLVRHAEVYNPDHVVYAALAGFGLSDLGWRQAEATGQHLAELHVAAVLSSPLQRAVETAATIASPHRTAVRTDERLHEWTMAQHWAGRPWESLPEEFPGELEAYLDHPEELSFSPESLAELADRVAAAIEALWASLRHPCHAVVVSHQDPIEAARRRLTGRGFEDFHGSKPEHATAITLVPDGQGWDEWDIWTPAQT